MAARNGCRHNFAITPTSILIQASVRSTRQLSRPWALHACSMAATIYEQFPVSPQAVSQHLKVLREAHLVEMEKQAQQHIYRLNLQTLSQFEAWVQHMKQRWEERFSALDTVLEIEKQKLMKGNQ